MAKTVCINQSNYIPWRGYFDLIRQSDEFLIADSLQYTHRDWRNRNQIKTPDGLRWISIPVHHADRVAARQRIDATRVADPNWSRQHLELFHHCYRRAAAFEPVIAWLQPLFRALADEPLLSVINLGLLKAIAGRLDLATPIRRTSDYLADAEIEDLDRTERIIRLCRAAGADRYLSGPAARTYLDEAAMAQAGIAVAWMDYSGYPPYPQPWGAFAPNVSIVDLLFCTGDEAGRYIGRGGD